MKKTILFLLCPLTLFVSCTSGDEPLDISLPITRAESTSEIYTPEEAVEFANCIAQALCQPTSRNSSRIAKVENVIEFYKNTGRAEESPFYMVNYNDNQGYAVIAKRKIANPIMAVINNGQYTDYEDIDNPGYRMFLDAASTYSLKDSIIPGSKFPDPDKPWEPGDGPIAATQYKEVFDTLAKTIIPPVLQEWNWGQHYPYGALYDNGVCGCSNTAMALIMLYYEPTYMKYTFPGAEKSIEYINWEKVKQHKGKMSWCCDAATHRTISYICRQLGYLGGSGPAKDNPNATATGSETYVATLKTVLLNKSVSNLKTYSYTDALNALKNGVILMRGRHYDIKNGVKEPTDFGHAWVADGCFFSSVKKTVYRKDSNFALWVYDHETSLVTRLISFNWGWNGDDNGYFNADCFNPQSQSDPDPMQYLECQFIDFK